MVTRISNAPTWISLREYQRRLAQRLDVMKPRFNFPRRVCSVLLSSDSQSAIAYGGKSANLGEVMSARLPGIVVPNGFTIPFYYYEPIPASEQIDDAIFALLNDQKFVHDPAYPARATSSICASASKTGKI